MGSFDDLGGQAITELTAPLAETATASMNVVSTLRFGVDLDGSQISVLLVGGEVIIATGKTLTSFTTLTRGTQTTVPKLHPAGTLVYDLSRNRTVLDHVRRGMFVRTARLEDLDVIGRNLGLHKCPGLDEETWRALIQVMAYLPNQTMDAFKRVLDVFPGVGNYSLYQLLPSNLNEVFVEIRLPLGSSLRGRFFLNGGEAATTDGAGATVTVSRTIRQVIGVYDDDSDTRRGNRSGRTNYYNPGGSFVGSTITLGTPTGPSAPVLVDYGAFTAHYPPANETIRYPGEGDFFPYLSDPSAIVRCLLDQIQKAGAKVNVSTSLV